MKRPVLFVLLALAVGCASPRGTASAPPAAAAPPLSTVAGPAGPLAVDDGGRGGGIPVVFVHGNGGNKSQWAAQLEHLRGKRRALAFDLHGMGKSAAGADGDFTVDSFAADVSAVADAAKLDRFVLVGHSYGGAVVCAYAGRHAERLAGLVFADVAGDLSATPPEQIEGLKHGLEPSNYAQFTDAWFATTLRNATDATRAAVMASLHATPREVFLGATLGLYAFRLSDALSRYHGLRLAITSYLADNPHAIQRTEDRVPSIPIAGASHWLMMDKPEEFNRILDEFLDRVEKGAPR